MKWEIRVGSRSYGEYEADEAHEAALQFYRDAGYDAKLDEYDFIEVDCPLPLDSVACHGVDRRGFAIVSVYSTGGEELES